MRLTWTTATETGNAGFRVQRKAGGANDGSWTTVGSLRGRPAHLPPQAGRHGRQQLFKRGVKEAELLSTYPNPAQQQVTLRYAVPQRQDVKIHLYDILGRRIQTVVNGERKGRHERQLDVSQLASGVYFLRLAAGGKTRTQKLTIVR
ncbi:MAG: hypothetical protein BRD43_00235 [Bacteroidetes bacterium QS_4_64_154]|nr:MAG: hypothetical protein BRD43_00235 [Bacteroidetes bacterium QS_4_64_154]